MPRRIQYAMKYEDLLADLVRSRESTGPFETKAKCLIWAAAFATSVGGRENRKKLSSDTGEPIRYDVFASQSFEDFICALGVFATQDINMLKDSEDIANQRVEIFEEFADYGLERLDAEMKGVVNKSERLSLLLLRKEEASISDGGVNWGKIKEL